jgi:hypothetical protein
VKLARQAAVYILHFLASAVIPWTSETTFVTMTVLSTSTNWFSRDAENSGA